MRLPDFLGIGAQKAGTTYLHGLLSCHPQLFMAKPKELHYFSLHIEKGIDWYQDKFSDANINQICGEITPYYLFHPMAASRICAIMPTVKLIVLLRDPVERAMSQYFHSCHLGFENLNIEEAFSSEQARLVDSGSILLAGKSHFSHQQHSYLSRSQYEEQLDRFYKYFSSEQICVIRSEDLFRSPELVWLSVLKFLKLDFCPLPQNAPTYSASIHVESDHLIHFKSELRDQLSKTYNWLNKQYFDIID